MKTTNHRYSKQRNTILQIVKNTDIHPNADWIYKETRKIIPNISLGTVYRDLNQLVENGYISMIKDKTLVRYDGNVNDHDHFRCTSCNTWYDIDILDKTIIEKITSSNNFKINAINLELEGICKKCLQNS